MRVPYPKPTTLSDPFHDWGSSGAEIEKILATDPRSLGHEAYSMIYYGYLPAANYEEGCYYVPYFLDFYPTNLNFKSPNLEGFFCFLNLFRERFEEDGLLEQILERVWNLFLTVTESFRVHRLTDGELSEFGICESYREMVPGSQTVDELIDCFTKWPVFEPVLEKMRMHFSDVSSPEHSFWFCECAFHTRLWLWVDSEPVQERQALFDFFHRFSLFSDHYRNSFLSRKSQIADGFFQYRRRLSPT